MADDRTRLKTTFDSAADRYQNARPEYPGPLYDALAELAGLHAGDHGAGVDGTVELNPASVRILEGHAIDGDRRARASR